MSFCAKQFIHIYHIFKHSASIQCFDALMKYLTASTIVLFEAT